MEGCVCKRDENEGKKTWWKGEKQVEKKAGYEEKGSKVLIKDLEEDSKREPHLSGEKHAE